MRCTSSLALAALLCLLPAAPAAADGVPVFPEGNAFNVPVMSLQRAKLRSVILQRYDYSCGSAALASLLTYHYNRPTAEDEIFAAMFAAGDQEKIKQVGFSLLDMKNYLARIGLRSDGFRVTVDTLAELRMPAIALIEINGYKHFVIIKGIRDGRVLVGDPALGLGAYPRARFERMWNGIAFMVRDEAKVAQASFNNAKDWSVQPRAPLGAALNNQPMASFAINLPMFHQF